MKKLVIIAIAAIMMVGCEKEHPKPAPVAPVNPVSQSEPFVGIWKSDSFIAGQPYEVVISAIDDSTILVYGQVTAVIHDSQFEITFNNGVMNTGHLIGDTLHFCQIIPGTNTTCATFTK